MSQNMPNILKKVQLIYDIGKIIFHQKKYFFLTHLKFLKIINK